MGKTAVLSQPCIVGGQTYNWSNQEIQRLPNNIRYSFPWVAPFPIVPLSNQLRWLSPHAIMPAMYCYGQLAAVVFVKGCISGN